MQFDGGEETPAASSGAMVAMAAAALNLVVSVILDGMTGVLLLAVLADIGSASVTPEDLITMGGFGLVCFVIPSALDLLIGVGVLVLGARARRTGEFLPLLGGLGVALAWSTARIAVGFAFCSCFAFLVYGFGAIAYLVAIFAVAVEAGQSS